MPCIVAFPVRDNPAYNIIFLGPSGVGKTHLAVTLGIQAVEQGYKVSFFTMEKLIKLLKTEGSQLEPGKHYGEL